MQTGNIRIMVFCEMPYDSEQYPEAIEDVAETLENEMGLALEAAGFVHEAVTFSIVCAPQLDPTTEEVEQLNIDEDDDEDAEVDDRTEDEVEQVEQVEPLEPTEPLEPAG